MKVLLSKRSSSGVTISSELQATTLEDGQMLNVIGTPGLFDSSLDYEFIGKEIVKCINMAQDGVDAFLVVVSTFSRFSEEEKAAISSLRTLFGSKVYDYMMVVFTGGDQIQEEGQTLEDFLCDAPEALNETLSLCGSRHLLFDNKTDDETKKVNQVKELLSLVNMVSGKNGGKPYTNEIFTEMKVDSKLKETALKLEQQLAEERAACVKAEKKAKAPQKKSDDKKRKLKEKLVKAEKKNKEIQQQREEERRRNEGHWCLSTQTPTGILDHPTYNIPKQLPPPFTNGVLKRLPPQFPPP
ncbi:hypothetical protein L1987_23006 [Smallanthus sonchifolius]|uniref:Uncharacterized protein n=1 Tax=Smallanthus sonchifolius TaxID=185202 RepID=A0ACB9IFQ5_9ASTR|nr:hypothetical protein L1987_23006 [Smallanthus sonchifolius]